MKRACTLVGALLLVACASTGARRSEPRSRLCISLGSPPVNVYRVDNKQRIGTLHRSGCIDLSDDVVDRSALLCVTAVDVPWCEPFPYTHWSASPVWSVRLGPFPSTWHMDVFTLQPAPAADDGE